MVKITSNFDHGNIRVIDTSDPSDIQLEIKPDGKADFFQWFYFHVDDAADTALTMRISNAGGASYIAGWNDYRAVASYDGEEWFRVDADYVDGVLTITHTPEKPHIRYAYFAAYPYERVARFVDQMKTESALTHQTLGETLDGRPIGCFKTGDGPLQVWVIARQHPGETMGSWWMEGFLSAVAGDSDAAVKLRKAAIVHIIPCMNPDGAARGHLRTNAAGTDLNRAWRNASMEQSPEVYLVRNAMRSSGVDFFLDVHGDEAIPNNFLDSAMGIPSWSNAHQARFEKYSSLLLEASNDFQTTDGYPPAAPGKANLDIANSYVAETWGCLSMTLEMPFKDAEVNPKPAEGWSPPRCRNFARKHLETMAKIVDTLG